MNRLHSKHILVFVTQLCATFHPNYVLKIVINQDRQVFIQKLLDIKFHAIPMQNHVKFIL